MESSKTVGITEVVLRDGIQSLLATRVPLRDLVSILPTLDKVGYWSLETWGGATYDSCIRYLNEDPWERLRTFNSLIVKSIFSKSFNASKVLKISIPFSADFSRKCDTTLFE